MNKFIFYILIIVCCFNLAFSAVGINGNSNPTNANQETQTETVTHTEIAYAIEDTNICQEGYKKLAYTCIKVDKVDHPEIATNQLQVIGPNEQSGTRGYVRLCGVRGGQVMKGEGYCAGDWKANPCEWTSSCSTGWVYAADNFEVGNCNTQCSLDTQITDEETNTNQQTITTTNNNHNEIAYTIVDTGICQDGYKKLAHLCIQLDKVDRPEIATSQLQVIGPSEQSGTRSYITLCGFNNGQVMKGEGYCAGEWKANPCEWTSSCSTGWVYAADNFEVGNCNTQCSLDTQITDEETNTNQQTTTTTTDNNHNEIAYAIQDTGICQEGYKKLAYTCIRVDKVDHPEIATNQYMVNGPTEQYGTRGYVRLCGIREGQVMKGEGYCAGDWTANPCEWTSSCSTGWVYAADNFVTNGCNTQCLNN